MAGPLAAGAAAVFGIAAGLASAELASAGLACVAAGIAAGMAAGAAAASVPHSALRKSFHFWPFKDPPVLAARYLALHSAGVRAWAGCHASRARPEIAKALAMANRVVMSCSP